MRSLFQAFRNLLLPRRAVAPVPVRVSARASYQRRAAYRHSPGRRGVEPTRYGDWEYNGRCADFD